MKKSKISIVVFLAMICFVAGIVIRVDTKGYGATKKGIYGNGLNGIYIDIDSEPYTTYAKKSYGEYAYTGEGCAWFASSRICELTGKDTSIFSGRSWYNTQYSTFGYERGSEPKAVALACYENHVAVIEKIEGDVITVSEGGMSLAGADYGYCIIHTMTREKLESARSGAFLGYVYINLLEEDKTPPVLSNATISQSDYEGYTLKVKVEDNEKVGIVRCATWTSENGKDDLIWKEMSKDENEDDIYYLRINYSSHGNGQYNNHLYAWDAAGNQCKSIQTITFIKDNCTDNLSYVIFNRKMTIYGTGDIGIYTSVSQLPWYEYLNEIDEIKIDNKENVFLGWVPFKDSWIFRDSTYVCATNWKKINNKWYYFNSDGLMSIGWKYIKGKWYYFGINGSMAISWKYIDGKWYYFDVNGAMVTSWKYIKGKWYYFDVNGAMVTGWKYIKGKWYYFETTGKMVTGWNRINEKWYYFNDNGNMHTGWLNINEKWYYLEENGAMVSGKTIVINSRNYSFDKSGVWIK